jgi:peptidoglycan/LPS O-acetylase OafA/YrhL
VPVPDALARAPAPGKHIPALDGVRGFAVLLVFVFHYGGGTHSHLGPLRAFGLLNKAGWSGVVLFFVLSGFLITGILWESFADPHWWRKFFARRVLRIFPLYYLALAIVVLGAIPRGTVTTVAAHLWIPGFFLENMPPFAQVSDNLPSATPIFHLWSIAVEEQFYLIWPFLLVLFRRNRRHASSLCLALFAASAAFRFFINAFAAHPDLFEHTLFTQAGALALGGWLALSFHGPEWRAITRLAVPAALLGFAAFGISGWLSGDLKSTGRFMMTFGLPAITLFFAALICLAVQPGGIARAFSMQWLRWVGNLSYGIYVFHILLLPVITILARRLAPHASAMLFNAVQLVIAAIVSLAAATLSFHLYERRFLRLKRFFVPDHRNERRAAARP